jgi:hypothetical protein
MADAYISIKLSPVLCNTCHARHSFQKVQRPAISLPLPPTLPARVQVLFKMDKGGNGEEICLEDLPHNRDISLIGFTHDMFLQVPTLPPSLASCTEAAPFTGARPSVRGVHIVASCILASAVDATCQELLVRVAGMTGTFRRTGSACVCSQARCL